MLKISPFLSISPKTSKLYHKKHPLISPPFHKLNPQFFLFQKKVTRQYLKQCYIKHYQAKPNQNRVLQNSFIEISYINKFGNMLGVQALPSQNIEVSMESEQIEEEPQMHHDKTSVKSNKFSTYKIILGVALLLIAALVGYKLYTLAYAGAAASQITDAHSKYIQNGDSTSGKDSGSTSGNSQSSKSSKDSSRPMDAAPTASKNIITYKEGSMGTGGGDDPNDEDDNDGEKRNKKMKDNSKFGDGSSTEQDSENSLDSDENEDGDYDQELDPHGMAYDTRNNLPLVGQTRP